MDVLRSWTGFGRTVSGEDISGQAVRRIAGDADLFALVMSRRGARCGWAAVGAPSPHRMGRAPRPRRNTYWDTQQALRDDLDSKV